MLLVEGGPNILIISFLFVSLITSFSCFFSKKWTPWCFITLFNVQFTIKKNKVRGDHFHNTKVEKFLILRGKVELIYENIKDNSCINKRVNSKNLQMFYSIPGWIHKIKNVGNEEVLGIVWSNEVFDKTKPDTFKY